MHSIYNYILLDTARLNGTFKVATEFNQNYLSLYKGQSEEVLADVAPYLFLLDEKNELKDWYMENGWGNAWGLLVNSSFSFEDTWKHFRKFLLVKTEDGKELYFRFYDPRVLRMFLPTCDRDQIHEFFGPIEEFIVEGTNEGEAIIFSHQNGILKQEIIQAKEIFKRIAD